MDFEAKIKELEDRLAVSEKEAAFARDYAEINNIMGRYSYLNGCGRYQEVTELFSKREDVSGEIAWFGRYEGQQGIRDLWVGFQGVLSEDRYGMLCNNLMCTPVVEIAEDRQTAQGIWFSPGIETYNDDRNPEEGEAYWCWGKYAVDFIREDGEWKIWHHHMFPIFKVRFDESWAKKKPTIEEYMEAARKESPDLPYGGPTTFMQEYQPDEVPKFWPQPPKPYKTFSETHSMVGAPPADLYVD